MVKELKLEQLFADSELFRGGFSVLGELYMMFIVNTVSYMPLAQLHHNT